MWVIGHRGAPMLAPENTLRGFSLAIESGADAVELDVRTASDGTAMVIHDDTVERVSNGVGSVIGRSVRELGMLRLADDQRIPTLKQAIQHINCRARVLIELKEESTIPSVLQVVNEAVEQDGWDPHDIMVIGFSLEALEEVRFENAEIPVGWSCHHYDKESLDYVIQRLKPEAINPSVECISCDLVDQAHAVDASVYCWTINDEGQLRRALSCVPDGIMTDNPPWLRTALAQAGAINV